ncbi:hypothetical protein CONPUDRAFT_167020 [Coniophora puteana RWD-64-598 SS2]|uniref:Uncharacterized protein n=1 Tax=Coniophora puteana (strain RWD-64-598) TaxID=741705 RepID=A0A5M3MJR1_CONPW|nr:uncharacterized protein CONPUDRAFT_167020 [Coniophora puteana RWD-64-598 SS2]EIW79237.1 hypothetical protein CONPUDRAFT_167020 [Coniophora puteana RWD-64-598 SS2]
MDRPATSKARGVCKYYDTRRGCYAGDTCKFLHGADERLTPYDKSKPCKFYAKGHCSKGDKCWFQHDLALRSAGNGEPADSAADDSCNICLEVPTTYGLLTDCGHVFCFQCIKQWRDPESKSIDMISSGVIKKCPLCRSPSRFITPSTYFFPQGHENKQLAIDAYKASMARVPCKYFVETSAQGKPCCPFGRDCFYQHLKPDGTPHVFPHGVAQSMHIYRNQRRNRRQQHIPFGAGGSGFTDPVSFLRHVFENPINNLNTTLDVIRASLPAILDRREDLAAFELGAAAWAADTDWDDATAWADDGSGSGWEATSGWGAEAPGEGLDWAADSSERDNDALGEWGFGGATAGSRSHSPTGPTETIIVPGRVGGHESIPVDETEATRPMTWRLGEFPVVDWNDPWAAQSWGRSTGGPGPTPADHQDDSLSHDETIRAGLAQVDEEDLPRLEPTSDTPTSQRPTGSANEATLQFNVPLLLAGLDEDELPPLVPLAPTSGSSSSRRRAPSLSLTSGLSGSSPQPAASPAANVSSGSISRFSTVVASRNREVERVVINLDEDEEDEAESEGEALILHPSNIRPASPAPSRPSSTSLPANPFAPQTPSTPPIPPSPSVPATAQSPSASSKTSPTPPSLPASASAPNQGSVEHNADPPFMTDGRGRVVWSSTRGGRADRQASRSRKTRRATATATATATGGDAGTAADARGRMVDTQEKSGAEVEESAAAPSQP